MNFKEYIDKDIKEKKVLLDLLPMNTEARVKKYKETVSDIISEYQTTLENVRAYIDYKYEKLLPFKTDKSAKINELNEKIAIDKQYLIETNPKASFYERLGLDMLIFDLEHYYNYSLQENNENIRKIITKFKSAGINVSSDDFKRNIFSYNYMSYLFQMFNGKDVNIEILKKLFWKCPNIYENIIIEIKKLINKYKKKLNNYSINNEIRILKDNNFNNREALIKDLYQLKLEKEKVEDKDESEMITDFMNGDLDFGVYNNTMNNLYGELDYFLINSIDTNNQELLDKTIHIIDLFYNNLLEYKGYSSNSALFDNIVNTYNKTVETVELKQLLKDYKAQKKKIDKLLSKSKKLFINKKLDLDNIEKVLTVDELNKCIEQQKILNEVYTEIIKLDSMYFNIILKKSIQVNSFVSTIINIVISYPAFSRSIIKSVFESENNQEVTDKYNEIFDLFYNPYRKLIDMKSVFSKENFERRLMDSYRLDNLNINDTTFEEDNQVLSITNYEKLKNKMKIAKFNHSIDEIEFLINMKKLKNEEDSKE